MIINEIFGSIDGEARRAGELATFVRTNTCCLKCSWCDSKYTWGEEKGTIMSPEEIVAKCKELGNRNITFTGGEPLIQKDSDELINRLVANNFDVSIETCGAVDWTERDWFTNPLLQDFQRGKMIGDVWVCADYKMPASGMTDRMLPREKFATLREKDVLKFVVGSRAELELAYDVVTEIRGKGAKCWVYLSPVFGMIEPREIVEFMQEKKWQDKVRAQLQLHKLIWRPDQRGV